MHMLKICIIQLENKKGIIEKNDHKNSKRKAPCSVTEEASQSTTFASINNNKKH